MHEWSHYCWSLNRQRQKRIALQYSPYLHSIYRTARHARTKHIMQSHAPFKRNASCCTFKDKCVICLNPTCWLGALWRGYKLTVLLLLEANNRPTFTFSLRSCLSALGQSDLFWGGHHRRGRGHWASRAHLWAEAGSGVLCYRTETQCSERCQMGTEGTWNDFGPTEQPRRPLSTGSLE